MSWWPRSMTDYQLPRALLSRGHAVRGCVNAAAFHLGYAAGRGASVFGAQAPAVLIVRTDGIGSALLAEPLMRSIGRRFSGHRIHLWAPAATCQLYRAAPFIHERLFIPRGNKDGNLQLFGSNLLRRELGYRLGRSQFEAVVYLAHSPEPLGNWLLRSVRAKQRWYNAGDTENQFASQREMTSASATTVFGRDLEYSNSDHELARNARLASQWQDNIDGQMPSVHLDDLARIAAGEQVRAWRQRAKWLDATSVVGIVSVPSKPVNQYRASSWVKVITDLWHEQRAVCALVGGADDQGPIQRLSIRLGHIPHLKMDRPMDLLSVAGIIGSLDGVVSVDTGLAHLALAQNIPTVTLVSGGHRGRYFPWPTAREAAVANHRMPCEGCRGHCHLAEAQCVTYIDPEQIVASMSELLKRRTALPLRAVA